MYSAFATDAGKPRSTERGSQITQEPAIYPRDANLHLLRNTMTSVQVAGPDRRRESILRVIGHCHSLLFRIKRRDVAHRPKDFLFDAPRRFWESSIDGWLHVKTIVAIVAKLRNSPTSYNRRSLFLRQSVIGKHLLSMLPRNQRTQISLFVIGPARMQAFHLLFQRFHKCTE